MMGLALVEMVRPDVAGGGGRAWESVRAAIDAEGSAVHPYARRLAFGDRRARRPIEPGSAAAFGDERRAAPSPFAQPNGTAPARRVDLSDAVHALCAVHGAHRGLADRARSHPAAGVAADWLDEVAAGLAEERAFLSRVVSAAGPLPSTPGQAATDAALAAQRHAFDMLGRSDRSGVATGAAAALALDWPAIRAVIARAGEAFGVAAPPLRLPDRGDTATVLDVVAGGEAAERAMLFGARALLAQHRALWDLLAARAGARAG